MSLNLSEGLRNSPVLDESQDGFILSRILQYMAQKGVVGLIMNEEDMPFTEDGIHPTIIMNPHGIPSRMTIGQLIEGQVGTLCSAKGTTTDATMFKQVDINEIANELQSLGLDRYGYRRLYSGITGEFVDSLIFMGPTYYQRLQKFTLDTQYAVSDGPSDAITHQPIDGGKSSGGGLRIGEMERDVLISHGGSKFLREKFFEHSDNYIEHICRCGRPAIVNVEKNIYICKFCEDNAEIFSIPVSWAAKLFMQELTSMNIGVRRNPTPFTYISSDGN